MTDALNQLAPGRGHCQICEWELTTPLAARVEALNNGDAPPYYVHRIRRSWNRVRKPNRNL